MIKITDKHNCCGCNACVDICPKQAISFKNDVEGFWYPEVNIQKCIDCSLCESICPCLNEKEQHEPLEVYAAVNHDEEIRRNSSSGGIFWAFVNKTFSEGGLVFGASFDQEWQVFHSSAETIEDAEKFRGSKYVQSQMTGCYKQVLEALKNGKKVLFSGTACQIAALKGYLRRDYNNLLAIDVVCHGVPSPGIWKEYIESLNNTKTIRKINFRDKRSGWRNYDFSVQFSDGSELRESHYTNLYMQGFLQDLYLRPSCHSCRFKAGRCGSDVTIGDFWGGERIVPEMDDNRGISIVLINTQKGKDVISLLPISLKEVDYKVAIERNPCIIIATNEKKWRKEFMERYKKREGLNAISSVLNKIRPSYLERLLCKIKYLCMRLQ